MGNMKKAAVVIILIIACALVLVSCDTKDDVTYYQETVVGKYGVGKRFISIQDSKGGISAAFTS